MALVCMICCEEATLDEWMPPYEEDSEGNLWVYCVKCDCWTSHPPNTLETPKLLINKETKYV